MLWVRLTLTEAEFIRENISTEEDGDEAFDILSAAMDNPIEEEIPIE